MTDGSPNVVSELARRAHVRAQEAAAHAREPNTVPSAISSAAPASGSSTAKLWRGRTRRRDGPIAREAQALGIHASVGCPITVDRRLWGVIAASTARGAVPRRHGSARRRQGRPNTPVEGLRADLVIVCS
jgi:hypothetical protein